MPALGQRRHTEGAGASCQRPGTRHVLKKETLDGSAGSGESDARNGGVGRFGGTEVEADGHGFRSVRVTPRHTAGALWPHHTSAVPHPAGNAVRVVVATRNRCVAASTDYAVSHWSMVRVLSLQGNRPASGAAYNGSQMEWRSRRPTVARRLVIGWACRGYSSLVWFCPLKT